MFKLLNLSMKKSLWLYIINMVTISRIILGLPLILSLINRKYECSIILLLIGSFTDYIDGYLARSKLSKSVFGAKLDPLADKIFIMGPLIWIAHEDFVPVWSVWLLLSREFLITGWRSDNLTGAPASIQGKIKTSFQFLSLILLLWPVRWASEEILYFLNRSGYILFWLSLLLAMSSGIKYIFSQIEHRH